LKVTAAALGAGARVAADNPAPATAASAMPHPTARTQRM